MQKISTWASPPQLLRPPESGNLHLWLIDLATRQNAEQKILSPEEWHRAQRLNDLLVRQRFIAARVQLRCILAQYLGEAPQTIKIVIGALGKPALFTGDTEIDFNLSHSGDLALLAISDGSPIGVDIETQLPRANSRAIAKRCFDAGSYALLESQPDSEFDREFIKQWTHFEARAKCMGGGVFRPVDRQIAACNFEPMTGWMAAVACRENLPEPSSWRFYRTTRQTTL